MYTHNLLIGEKVRLTPTAREDITTFAEWFKGSPIDLSRNAGWEPAYPYTYENEIGRFERSENRTDNFSNFSVRRMEDDRIIGNAILRMLNRPAAVGSFGIHIGETGLQGQGYGSDALQVLMKYAFLEVNLHRLELESYGYNPRAIRAYEKVGFRHEGRARQAVLRDGEYHDIVFMSILKYEWMELYARE